MRLIRTILVISGAGFLLPSPPDNVAAQKPMVEAQQVSTFEMLSSATSAVSDVAGFCLRQPDVCETASFVAGRLEAKAKYSVKLIYEWASESTSDPAVPTGTQEAIKVDMLATGSIRLAKADVPPKKSQSTLTIEDILPEWRGPAKEQKKEG
jgi:Family of unknown function (DUF5330)